MVEESAPVATPNTLHRALELARAGYFLAPVRIHRDRRTGAKSPDYLRIRWHDESTDDPEQLRDWYVQHGPDVSYLVDCGRSGLFVVDLDVPRDDSRTGESVWNAEHLPLGGMVVATPSGGYHHYWRQPDGQTLTVHKRIHGHPIDVRAMGGHVYAPGSVVLNPDDPLDFSATYRITGAGLVVPVDALPELPEVVSEFLHARHAEAKRPSAQGELRRRGDVVEICRGQLAAIEGHDRRTESGFRGTLMGAAMVCGRAVAAGMYPRGAIVARLERAVAVVWGTPNEDDRRWIRDGLEAGVQDPWTVVPDDYDTEVQVSAPYKIHPAAGVAESNGNGQVPTMDVGGPGGGSVELTEEVPTEISTGGPAPVVEAVAELDDEDTWAPVDLGPYLDGTVSAPQPAVGIVRSDGARFLYPGLEHAVIGEMESGKSWFALACAAAELRAGNRAVYVHFEESSPADTVKRLGLLGVPVELIRGRFVFVGPERRMRPADVERILAGGVPTLVVLDGVNEGMALHGMGINDADGASDWRRRIVRPWTRVGAAVVSLDHVVKDQEKNRQGYASGNAGKGNGITGAQFLVENLEPFGLGRDGASMVTVTKDRPAQLRRLGRPTKIPRKFFLGMLRVENAPDTEGGWRLRFDPPGQPDDGEDPEFAAARAERRSAEAVTELDGKVLAVVVDLAGKGIEVSSNKVAVQVGGRKQAALDALYRLEAAGEVINTSYGQAARWSPKAIS